MDCSITIKEEPFFSDTIRCIKTETSNNTTLQENPFDMGNHIKLETDTPIKKEDSKGFTNNFYNISEEHCSVLGENKELYNTNETFPSNFERLFVCYYCGFTSDWRKLFIKHVSNHLNNTVSAILNFKSKSSAILSARSGKPFACSVCSYTCITSSILKQHNRVHTGERPFVCGVCSFRTTRSGLLKQHMRIHTGEKPFYCEICGYRTAIKANFVNHGRIHTGKKPYLCNVCDFKTTRSSSLKQHQRVHTGEKPFSCKVCEFKSNAKSNLRKHERTHGSGKSFGCNYCTYRGISSAVLKIHMRVHCK